MSNVLKTAAIVVGAVALVSTGIGLAAGAGIGLGLSTGTLATIATVAKVASFAAGVLSLAGGLTAKKPTADATGSQTSFSADPDAGVPLAIGRTGTAGDIVMRRGWDTRDAGDNDRQAFAAVLSLGPIAAIEGQTVDRVPVAYSNTGAAIGAFAGFMWSMTQLGALASPALAFGAGAGTPPGVGADFKLSGKAAATWTLRFDTKAKLYQNGVPAPMWTVRGALAYDPTKDSTYPGGNGPHRMADPADTAAYDAAMATWEWTENPYLLGLRWAHGYWQRDVSNPNSTYQRVMGMGSPWRLIDVAAFVEGRNIAAANGWTAGGMIYSRDEKWATMKKILQAGMGEPMPLGARISCLVNAPKVSLATVTIQDVIGSARVATTQPRRNRINTVTPRYRLEENNWQFLPGSPISITEHIVEDGGKRSKVLDYPFIQNTKQIGTAVRYDIENSREFGPITLPLKLFWMGYKPGDCVTADLPEVGLNRQPILLLNRDLDPAGGVTTFTARSETNAKHAFALGQTATPPPTPGVTGPPLVPVPAIDAWAITATSLISQAQTVPALVVTGSVDANTADAVVIEYRPFVSGQAANVGWTSAGIWAVGASRVEITSVRSGAPYEVSVSYQRNGVTGGRRIIGPVVTSGVAVDYDAVVGPNRPQPGADKTADHPEAYEQWTGRKAVDVVADLNQNILNVSAEMVVNGTWRAGTDQILFVDGKPIRQVIEQLGVTAEGHTLFITQLQEVDANTGTARFMFAANANGDIVGIQGTAGGGINQLSFVADRVQFVDPNGGNAINALVYDEDNVWRLREVEATLIKADTIVTKHLVTSSISQTQVVPVSGNISIARNASAVVATKSMTKQEPDSVMKVTFFGMFQSDDDIQMTCTVEVDGVTSYPAGRINNVFDSTQSKAESTITPFVYITDLPAGDHTFAFRVVNQEVDPVALIVKMGSAMEILEQKRPLL